MGKEGNGLWAGKEGGKLEKLGMRWDGSGGKRRESGPERKGVV